MQPSQGVFSTLPPQNLHLVVNQQPWLPVFWCLFAAISLISLSQLVLISIYALYLGESRRMQLASVPPLADICSLLRVISCLSFSVLSSTSSQGNEEDFNQVGDERDGDGGNWRSVESTCKHESRNLADLQHYYHMRPMILDHDSIDIELVLVVDRPQKPILTLLTFLTLSYGKSENMAISISPRFSIGIKRLGAQAPEPGSLLSLKLF